MSTRSIVGLLGRLPHLDPSRVDRTPGGARAPARSRATRRRAHVVPIGEESFSACVLVPAGFSGRSSFARRPRLTRSSWAVILGAVVFVEQSQLRPPTRPARRRGGVASHSHSASRPRSVIEYTVRRRSPFHSSPTSARPARRAASARRRGCSLREAREWSERRISSPGSFFAHGWTTSGPRSRTSGCSGRLDICS